MSFDLQARTLGVHLSRKARALLSMRAMNDLVREGLIHGGEEWIAQWLPRRFQRGYAELLGYRTSPRRDPWASRRNLPPTYDDRKRAYQGHTDPLVWTGRLRHQVMSQARATATATRGQARGRITFGRLAVGSRGRFVAPPRVVVDTLLGGPARRLPRAEVATVRDGFLAYVTATLDGVTTPQAKPLFPPGVIMDRRSERFVQRRAAIDEAGRQQAAIGDRARERRLRLVQRWQAWRQDAGGSSPIGQRVMTPGERIARHRAQALASYHRRRHVINPRRRLRRRGAI